MTDVDVKYLHKTVTTVRGLEARSIAKWEAQGWELVSQTPAKLLRTTLTFRRLKKQIPRWVWAAALAVVAALGIGVAIVASQDGGSRTTSSATEPSGSVTESAEPSPSSAAESSAAPVTAAEVIAAFHSYFVGRASAGVLWGKAVSKVTFVDGVVRVTFDPAAADVSQATFNSLAANFNFPDFAATPIAFDDDIGNRLRPAIDRIDTVRADGTSLGSIDAAGILALNGLSK